jgi:hypothetical protein
MRSAANDFLRCSSAKGFVSRQNHDFKRNSDPDENEAPFSWQFLAEQRQSQIYCGECCIRFYWVLIRRATNRRLASHAAAEIAASLVKTELLLSI